MIRLMHVISGLDQGGAEAMLMRLLRVLDRDSFSQSVVSLTTRGVYGDQVEAYGVPLFTLGMTGFAAMSRSLVALCAVIEVQQPAIVQTWLYHADLLGLIAARLTGDASVAWNVRCAGLGPGDVPLSTRWLRWLLAQLSSQPDTVLFNSMAGQEAHRAIGYHPRRSEVIPNGFDLDERRPDPVKRAEFRAEIGVDSGTFLVGMVARAHRMKDQSTFLVAAARLKEMSDRVRFVMVGLNHNWSNRSLVSDIERNGLRDQIVLLGLRQDVPRIMAGLDCLVSTSMSEGFPNVIGEAMACGVPCIATDAGDSRLIVADTGIIVPVGDVAGVVAGISQLLAAGVEERQLRSQRCRQRIVDHFELSRVAGRYAACYRELNDRRVSARQGVEVGVAAGELTRGVTRALEGLKQDKREEPIAGPKTRAWRWRIADRVVRMTTRPSPGTAETPSEVPRYFGRRRTRLLGRIGAATVALWVVLFHTPLVWFAGSQLTIRQQPVTADAIVVFSGNGESTYLNSGYQRRARDAARYYKAGYAPLLVISSGIEQTFAEVEIVRALLLSQGVPPAAMCIVTKYPTTTFENVQIVYDVLKQQSARSILFITAPYHSRRSSMIWNKIAPRIRVTTVPVIDTPPTTPQWNATVDQIRAIAYEYAAIAYNRAKGWL